MGNIIGIALGVLVVGIIIAFAMSKKLRKRTKKQLTNAADKVADLAGDEAFDREIAIEEFEELVAELQSEITDLNVDKKQAERDAEAAEEDIEKWEQLTNECLDEDDEEGAKQCAKQLAEAESVYAAAIERANKLEETYNRLKAKLDEKKEEIKRAHSGKEIFEAKLKELEADENLAELENKFGKFGSLDFGDDLIQKRRDRLDATAEVSESSEDAVMRRIAERRKKSTSTSKLDEIKAKRAAAKQAESAE